MLNARLDWTSLAGKSLSYFNEIGISLERLESFIDDVYNEIASLPEDQRGDLIELVGIKLSKKVKQDLPEGVDMKEVTHQGIGLTNACLFYCFSRLYEGEEYTSFYDFLAKSKCQLKS